MLERMKMLALHLFVVTLIISTGTSARKSRAVLKIHFISYVNPGGLRLNGTGCDIDPRTNRYQHEQLYGCFFFLNTTFTHGSDSWGPHTSIYSLDKIYSIVFGGLYTDVHHYSKKEIKNPITWNLKTPFQGSVDYYIEVLEQDGYRARGKDVFIIEKIETFKGKVGVSRPDEWVHVTEERAGRPDVKLHFKLRVECDTRNETENSGERNCFDNKSQKSTIPSSTSTQKHAVPTKPAKRTIMTTSFTSTTQKHAVPTKATKRTVTATTESPTNTTAPSKSGASRRSPGIVLSLFSVIGSIVISL